MDVPLLDQQSKPPYQIEVPVDLEEGGLSGFKLWRCVSIHFFNGVSVFWCQTTLTEGPC